MKVYVIVDKKGKPVKWYDNAIAYFKKAPLIDNFRQELNNKPSLSIKRMELK